MKVVITGAAKADLIAIGDFIRSDNPERALRFVEALLDRCEALADRPRAYPLVPRYEPLGIRRAVYRGYLIFYRIHTDRIEIIRIVQGRRDYEALFRF